MEMAGSVIALVGSLVFLLSALGVLRMPDIYNRIQTGTKATTLGLILTMVGISLYHPSWAPKLLVLILFIVLTNPISSHVVARASHFGKEKMSDKTIKDSLDEREEKA